LKVVILAGGFGTRMSEYTGLIPKPMVTVGGRPIIWHIMNIYAKYGHHDFYIALGYKSELIKEYFLNYKTLNSDFTINLNSGDLVTHNVEDTNWNVTLVNTGPDSMTGGRIKRMQKYIGNEPCLFTYGDGVSNVDIDKLISYHKSHGKMVTVTAVHPGARFGELDINNGKVESFKEKPQVSQGWINGGFFIAEPEFFDLIDNDYSILEQEPLERASKMGELMAYHHDGYWQCMDTKRDRDHLEELWMSGSAPWA
jgi:glucose-1-phosphate cytidylyltransferase